MTLIVLDPFRIPAGSGPVYDPDAQAMFNARAAVGDPVPAPYMQAISDYVVALKAVPGLWAAILQLVVMAGATTVAGARIAIKGLSLTSNNFVNGDVDLKTGVRGNNTNKWWDTGNTLTGRQNSHHAYTFITELPTLYPAILFGTGGAGNGSMGLGFASAVTVIWRSSHTTSVSAAPGPAGGFGLTRTSSANYQRMNSGGVATVAQVSQAPSTRPILVNARTQVASNSPEGWSNSRALVWAFGDGITTLADYNTPTANLVAALNAI